MTRRLLRSQRGFTYIAVMVMVIIMGITLGAAGTYWGTRMKRERETELLWRGIQYRDALRGWYGWDSKTGKLDPKKAGQRGNLTDLKELVRDKTNAGKVRFLRKLYLDPVTGKEFDVVKGANQQIIGVKSSSEQKPLKQGNFPDEPETGLMPDDFEAKEKYSDWQFIFDRAPKSAAAGTITGAGSTPGAPGSTPGKSEWKGFTVPPY